jgi:DtxR family Mn-dependent transcriptional regulator
LPSLTVENYIKAIFQVSLSNNGQAATGQLAHALGVSPGTVTSMLKTLSEGNLVSYTPYEGVRLTDAGNVLALRVVRRHRLIEQFLVKTLDLSWDEVHEEAEHMEHAVSDRLVDKIDAFLGHPTVDPHGDPIPQADGTLVASDNRTLAECQVGEQFRLARVVDQSPEFLRFLSNAGLELGTAGKIVANSTEAGIVTVAIGGNEKTLGRVAAEKLLVTFPQRAT